MRSKLDRAAFDFNLAHALLPLRGSDNRLYYYCPTCGCLAPAEEAVVPTSLFPYKEVMAEGISDWLAEK